MHPSPRDRETAMFDSSLQRIREITGIPTRHQEFSARVARLTPFDGIHQTALPSLALTRGSVPTVCMPTIYQPCLAIVVQGRKRAILNDEVFHYDAHCRHATTGQIGRAHV